MSSPASLLIWHPKSGQVIADVECGVTAVVSDDDQQVVYELVPQDGGLDFTIPSEWAGMNLTVEVSPRAVTSDPLTRAVADVAKRMGVPVG